MSPYSIPGARVSACRATEAKILAIVHHLHVVTRAGLADPVAAGVSVDLGSGLLEDILDGWPCSGGATGHKGRAVSGALLASRNTRSDEEKTVGLQLFGATDGIRVVRIATIDNNISFLEVRNELIDEVIDCLAGLDEENDLAGPLELRDELLNGVCSLDVGACDGDWMTFH